MKKIISIRSILLMVTSALVATAFTLVVSLSVTSNASAQAGSGGKLFATPENAADALITAAENFDETAFTEILGPDSYDIIHSGEPTLDRQVAADFAKLGREKKTLSPDKRNRRMVLLAIGDDNWPFPLPLVKVGTQWRFDTAAGRQEILFRRVGRNELDAIDICRNYVKAQYEYASQKRDGARVNQYAQRVISTPDHQDGLAWRNSDGTVGGPVGEEIAKAIAQGYTDKTSPYHGYYFKVLKGQGPAAPLGQMDFVINGAMIGGFALVAFPAQYQVTGVKTFLVSQGGVVYEKDLGPTTLDIAKSMDVFNPDRTWQAVLDDN
ncbi:MAG: DUF2950 domain-containing protein [Pyrinomonadaceae bacterium]